MAYHASEHFKSLTSGEKDKIIESEHQLFSSQFNNSYPSWTPVSQNFYEGLANEEKNACNTIKLSPYKKSDGLTLVDQERKGH